MEWTPFTVAFQKLDQCLMCDVAAIQEFECHTLSVSRLWLQLKESGLVSVEVIKCLWKLSSNCYYWTVHTNVQNSGMHNLVLYLQE